MKKYLNFIFLIVVSLSLNSCIIKSSGGKFYNVQSKTAEGKEYLNENKVEYHVKKHFAVMWADFYEGDGEFLVEKDGKYYKLKNDFVNEKKIQADYNIWQSYGWIPITLILGFLLYFFGIYFDLI